MTTAKNTTGSTISIAGKGFTISYPCRPLNEHLHKWVNNPENKTDPFLYISHESLSGLSFRLWLPEDFKSAEADEKGTLYLTVNSPWQTDGKRMFHDWINYKSYMDIMYGSEILIESSDTLAYTIRVRNDSKETVTLLNSNICFNYAQARPFGEHVWLPVKDRWIDVRELDKEGKHTYFLLSEMQETCEKFSNKLRPIPYYPDANPSDGLIVTTAIINGKHGALGHACLESLFVWCTNHPCTDITVLLGDLQPGQEKIIKGRIYLKADQDLDWFRAKYRNDKW